MAPGHLILSKSSSHKAAEETSLPGSLCWALEQRLAGMREMLLVLAAIPSRSPGSQQQRSVQLAFSCGNLERWGNAAWESPALQQHQPVSTTYKTAPYLLFFQSCYTFSLQSTCKHSEGSVLAYSSCCQDQAHGACRAALAPPAANPC